MRRVSRARPAPAFLSVLSALSLFASAAHSAPAVADVPAAPQLATVSFPEGSALRAATCAAADVADGTGKGKEADEPKGPHPAAARLAGPDAALFELDGAAIRFRIPEGAHRHRLLPDFERPADADGDNRYEVTVVSGEAGGGAPLCAFAIEIADRDEPGRVSLSTRRPKQGEAVAAFVADPDGPLDGIAWRWQRSTGRDAFADIEGATGPAYTPAAADTGRLLRAEVSYRDRHGAEAKEKVAGAVTAHAVLGPRLTALAARSGSHPSGGLNPPFDPSVAHYAVACGETDVLSLTFAAGPELRVDVNGIQPRPGGTGGAAVPVTWTSDVVVTAAAADGGATRYTLHCAPPDLAGLLARAGADPAPGLSGMRLAIALRAWVAVIDEHGVPRVHRRVSDREHASAGFFLLPFGAGEDRRWVHSRPVPRPPGTPRDTPRLGRAWQVLDAGLSPIRTVTAAPPLVTTGVHDFRLLEDGSALLMTYEPAVRDFSHLSGRGSGSPGPASVVFDDPEGSPWGEAVETDDSAIQIVGADGTARWTWNSWGRMPLEDCAQHRFPRDYAHVNSVQMTRRGVVASFRGCSSVMLIDPAAPETPAGAGIVWRIGASNLSAEDWAARGLGPAPLALAGDPEGAFCGQHAATLVEDGVPEPRLLLFDNGVQCVTNPATREPLGRAGGDHSRGVEYALDLEHGEAVFVRDASLGGRRDALGAVGGHLAVLEDGSWLIAWGRTGSDPAPAATVVSRVDPATGGEGFALLRAGLPEGVPAVRAVPVPAAALEVPAEPLTAFFPEAGPLAAEDGDAGGDGAAGLAVAVAFSRPVAAFGAGTPSVAVEGGRLVSAAPWRAFGKPAHAWRLGILPESGNGPLRISLRPGAACGEGGICAADGTPLTGPPALMEIDPEVGK